MLVRLTALKTPAWTPPLRVLAKLGGVPADELVVGAGSRFL